MKTLLLVIVAAGGLAGCATMEPRRGFDEVSGQVRERTGMDAHWRSGTEEDARADAALQDLLGRELTADAAVQIALINNRDLQAVYEELDITQADLVRAGLLENPVFSGELRFDTSGGGTGVALGLTQGFLSLLTMPLRTARAGSEFEAAKARVTQAAVTTAFDTFAAFYEYQAAEEVLGLRLTVEQAAAASHELARRIREAGNMPELDYLSERALYEQARLDVESAQVATTQRRERLNALMGLWGPDTGWHAGARLPDPVASEMTPEELERRSVEASLELAAARFEIESAAAGARLVQPLTWLDGSEAGVVGEREVEGDWSVGPEISVPIPIFDMGSAGKGEAAARLRQAEHRYYATAVRVRAGARESAAVIASARERVVRFRTVLLPMHEQIVHQAQLQYNAMQISGFQLLQARREQIEVGVASIEALRDYWIAQVGVLRIVGGGEASTPGDLGGRNATPRGQGGPDQGGH
ncbi:MAG: TolC family protein [Phycisphaerales bacterium]|nr:TolC family protein [Phycisphaerales bacterium]